MEQQDSLLESLCSNSNPSQSYVGLGQGFKQDNHQNFNNIMNIKHSDQIIAVHSPDSSKQPSTIYNQENSHYQPTLQQLPTVSQNQKTRNKFSQTEQYNQLQTNQTQVTQIQTQAIQFFNSQGKLNMRDTGTKNENENENKNENKNEHESDFENNHEDFNKNINETNNSSNFRQGLEQQVQQQQQYIEYQKPLSQSIKTQERNFVNDQIRFVYSEESSNKNMNLDSQQYQQQQYQQQQQQQQQQHQVQNRNGNSWCQNLALNQNNQEVIQTLNHTYYGFNKNESMSYLNGKSNNNNTSNQDQSQLELSCQLKENKSPVYISSNFNELSKEVFVNQNLYKYGFSQRPIDIEQLVVNRCLSQKQNNHDGIQKCRLDSSKIQQVYVMVDILNGIVCYYIRTFDRQVFQKKCILDKWRTIYSNGYKAFYHSRTICLENVYNCFRYSKWFQGKVNFLADMFLEETINEKKDLEQFKTYQSCLSQNLQHRQFIQIIPEKTQDYSKSLNLISDIRNQQQACLPVSVLGKINSRFQLDFKPEGVLVFELEPIDFNSKYNSPSDNGFNSLDFLENLLPDIYVEYHAFNYNLVQDNKQLSNLASYLIPNETTIISSHTQYRGQAMQLYIQQRPFDFGGNVVLGFPIKTMIEIDQIPSSWVTILNQIFQFKNQQILNPMNNFNFNQTNSANGQNTHINGQHINTNSNSPNNPLPNQLLSIDRFETLSIEVDESKWEVKLVLQKKSQKISSLCLFGSQQLLVYKEQHNEFIKQKKWFIGYNSQLYVLI